MTEFFLAKLLPMSAVGAASVLMLYLTDRLLYRVGKTHWGAPALLAALGLFCLPLHTVLGAVSQSAAPNAALPGLAAASAAVPPAGAAAPAPAPLPLTAAPVRAPQMVPIDRLCRLAALLWLVGAAVMLMGTCISYARFVRRLCRGSRPVGNGAVWEQFADARRRSGLRGRVRLRETEAIVSPMAVGLLRLCVYLPACAGTGGTLRCALLHECTHLRRGHIACKFAAQLLCCAHWFNPAAWLLRRMMNDACELDCDRAVTRDFDASDKKRYCAALLAAAEGERAPLLAGAFARPAKKLRRRMESILAPRPHAVRRATAAALCAALIFSVAALTACAAGDAARAASAGLSESETTPESRPADAPETSSSEDAPESRPADAPEKPSFVDAPEQEPAEGADADDGAQAAASAPVWPVPAYTYLTCLFGGPGGHRGVDICAAEGADILAVKGGVVAAAQTMEDAARTGTEEAQKNDAPYGNYVLIDHGDGTTTLYAHCLDLAVREGERVEAGQVIAHVGSTGVAAGTHCHLEYMREDVREDPLTLFEALPQGQWSAESGLVWPLPGYASLSASFGATRHGSGDESIHDGIDIPAPDGTEIRAAADGVVSTDGPQSYGISVRVTRADGLETFYAHMSACAVKDGEAVTAGQLIGYVGSTGNSTGSHLHFSVRRNGEPLDPMTFFDGAQSAPTDESAP